MKKKIVKRLMVMLLTASVLLSSTGISSIIVSAEDLNSTATSAVKEKKTTSETEKTTSAQVTTEGGELDRNGVNVITGGGRVKHSVQSLTIDYNGGTGTQQNPYQINTLDDFLGMQSIINNTSSADKYFKLTADIDLSPITFSGNLNPDYNFKDYYGFTSLISMNPADAVSYPSNVFFSLDGDGYTISGLDVTSQGRSTTAIFGYLSSNTVIDNVSFINCNLTTSYMQNAVSAVLAVQNAGTISNCEFNNLSLTVTGNNTITTESVEIGSGYMLPTGYGIICGSNLGTIGGTNTPVTASNITISITGTRKYIGCVTGQNKGTISDVSISGIKITSTPSSPTNDQSSSTYSGAIAGYNHSGYTITKCSVDMCGTGTPVTNNFTKGGVVGGISGYNAGTVSYCTVQGSISNAQSVTASHYNMYGMKVFGGIVAENEGSVVNCSALDIGMYYYKPDNLLNIYGGIVGKNSSTSPISKCIATGKVGNENIGSFYTYLQTGGIIGQASSGTVVENCYALVSLPSLPRDIGAVIGRNGSSGVLTNCYWSAEISGRSNPCAYSDSQLLTNSMTRAVSVLNVAVEDTDVPVSTTDVVPTWGNTSIDFDTIAGYSLVSSDTGMSLTQTQSGFEIDAGTYPGAWNQVNYNVNIEFPTDIGAQETVISQQLTVTVLQTLTAEVGAGLTYENPIIISNSNELNLIRHARYSHFKLGADINVPSGWIIYAFSGTLNGDGHELTVISTLFSGVYGKRDSNTSDLEAWKTSASNLRYGYICNLDITLNGNISSAIFGKAFSATFSDVNLYATANGKVTTSATEVGSFLNEIEGNCYLTDCMTDIDVIIERKSCSNVGGFAGRASGVCIIEDCGSQSDMLKGESFSAIPGTPNAIGGFIGSVGSNARITNCFTSGLVNDLLFKYLIFGSVASGAVISNVYWSFKSDDTSVQPLLPTSPLTTGFVKWAFNESAGSVAPGGSSYVTLNMPQGIEYFENVQLSDLTIDYDNTMLSNVSTVFQGPNNSVLRFNFSALGDVVNTTVTITHNQTGLKARINILNGLSKDLELNAYIISTRDDLIFLNENYPELAADSTLDEEDYVIRGDIDMEGYEFTAMGTYQTISERASFQGSFFGDEKPGGGKYTISNLNIVPENDAYGNPLSYENVAFFQSGNGCSFSNLDFVNITSTGSGLYSSIFVGYMEGDCSFTDISITNANLTATTTNAGIFAGIIGVDNSHCIISGVTINGATVSAPNSRFVGGLVGSFVSTGGTLQIGAASNQDPVEPDVVINDLNVNGSEYVGGLVGMAGATYSLTPTLTTAVGTLTINGVSIDKTGESNSSITAQTGFAGGFVSSATVTSSSIIKNCSISNTTVNNVNATSNTQGGITGGFAGAFLGTIRNCNLYDSRIEGAVAAGIIARTASAANDMTVENCNVLGNTEIVSNGANNSSASGIFGQHNRRNNVKVIITGCNVGSDVEIGGGVYNAGIMGYHHALATYADSIVEISSCKTYADIYSGNVSSTLAGTGGIIGTVQPINSFSVSDCVVSGNISGIKATGGVIGYVNSMATVSYDTSKTIAKYCYLDVNLGSIQGATSNSMGKVFGGIAGTSSYCLKNDSIDDAFKDIIFSSFPDGVSVGFGTAAIQAYANATSCYYDANRPYYASAGENRFIDGSASAITLTNSSPTQTISIVNLPNSPMLTGFTFDDEGGWSVVDSECLEIDNATFDINGNPATVSVSAFGYGDNGVSINYYSSSVAVSGGGSPMDASDPQTNNPFRMQICVPINCNIVDTPTGDGSENNPYIIITKSNWTAVAGYIEDDNSEYTYIKLNNDLEFTQSDAFTPIGTAAEPFYGEFDGQSNTVSGVQNFTSLLGDYVGLFASAENAVIKNINVEDFTYNSPTVKRYAGGILAYGIDVTLQNINARNITISNLNVIGGVVGHAEVSTSGSTVIENTEVSSVNLTAITEGTNRGAAGGVAGEFIGNMGDSTLSSGYDVIVKAGTDGSTVVPNVINGTEFAGGAVGRSRSLSGGSLTSVYSRVNVSGSIITATATKDYNPDHACAGGILGLASSINDDINISNCMVEDDVNITGTNRMLAVGGIIGGTESSALGQTNIIDSQSFANVDNNSETQGAENAAGGIVGYVKNPQLLKVSGCVAGGTVQSLTNAGGIIGHIVVNLQIAPDRSLADVDVTTSMVLNTVVSAKVSGTTAFGIVIGAIDNVTIIFPDSNSPSKYYVEPIKNVYYSSYENIADFTGNGTLNTAQQYLMYDGGSGTPTSFRATYHDLNSIQYYDGTLMLSSNWQKLQESDIVFNPSFSSFISGNYQSFTADANIACEIDPKRTNEYVGAVGEYKILTAEDILQPEFSDFSAGDHVMRATIEEAAGQMILIYNNGLKLSLGVIAFGELEGNGSADNPFILSAVDHFSLLRSFPDRYFKLGANIDFSNESWEPIDLFTGSFDGYHDDKYYEIQNLTISGTDNMNLGFFRRVSGVDAIVKNLTFNNITVTGNNGDLSFNMGAIAGILEAGAELNNNKIKNSSLTCTSIKASAPTIKYTMGGIVGNTDMSPDSKISFCSVESSEIIATETHTSIVAIPYYCIGGIAGAALNVDNCTVKGTDDSPTIINGTNIGGIVGSPVLETSSNGRTAVFENCSLTGTVYAEGSNVGGILGSVNILVARNYDITVRDCYVGEQVSLETKDVVSYQFGAGGIIGSLNMSQSSSSRINSVIIDGCQSYATVVSSSNAGGIIAVAYSAILSTTDPQQLKITDCVGSGNITSTNTTTSTASHLAYRSCGGIIGKLAKHNSSTGLNSSLIENCIVSAQLAKITEDDKMPSIGYVVGGIDFSTNLTTIIATDASATDVFKSIYYSSYQQKSASNRPYSPFGDVGCGSDDVYFIEPELTDVARKSETEGSFMARSFLDNPDEEFNPIAIAPFMIDEPSQLTYTIPVKIMTDSATDLGLVTSGEYQNFISAAGLNITLDSFSLNQSGQSVFNVNSLVIHEDRKSVSITPIKAGGGYLEAVLTAGLKVGIMILSFEIEGSGVFDNPFIVDSPEVLKIISDLPYDLHWKQTQDIEIDDSHYDQNGGVFYNDGKGFKPIGNDSYPFEGHYDGDGYVISGLYINDPEQSNVGLFGKVDEGASLKNIHLEISEMPNLSGITGKDYVGGIAGSYCSEEIIENCSVSHGTITGELIVGGIVGQLDGSLRGCFTTSTVYSFSENNNDAIAGGLAGELLYSGASGTANIEKCFSTSIVHAQALSGGLVGHVANNNDLNLSDSFFTGSVSVSSLDHNKQAPILIGYLTTITGTVTANNIYAAGANVHFGQQNCLIKVGLDTDSSNIYYDSNMTGTLDSTNSEYQTGIVTSQMTDGSPLAGLTAENGWLYSSGSYPRLNILKSDNVTVDDYAALYCALATAPVIYHEKDTTGGADATDGVLFPVKISQKVDGMNITPTSSTYSSDFSTFVGTKSYEDSVNYPEMYDINLYGNGGNRSTDLLFKNEDGYIYAYRNVFGTTVGTIKYQKMNTPAVTYEVTGDGITATRNVRIPYTDETLDAGKIYHYYISTERQLRAIMDINNIEAEGSKFSYYEGVVTTESNVSVYVNITGDIELCQELFTPIHEFKGKVFDGNGFKISDMYINNFVGNAGFFSQLTSSSASSERIRIRNLVFENSTVMSTGNNVGTLAGSTDEGILIYNCSVVNDGINDCTVSGSDFVGGLIGKTSSYIGYEHERTLGENIYTPIEQSSGTNVQVTGTNFAGGFVGYASNPISNCYANGSVSGRIDSDPVTYQEIIGGISYTFEEPRGIGGFVGVLKSKVEYSFSSSDVTVYDIDANSDFSKVGIGGFAGYIISGEEDISSTLFSSGKIIVFGIGEQLHDTQFGIGGLVGVSDAPITSCYSSSAVNVDFPTGYTTNATLGVGGVIGIANTQLGDAYSSGYVERTNYTDPVGTKTIGGVIGNATDDTVHYTQLYFDKLNNNDQTLTAIGGEADSQTQSVKGIDTRDFFGTEMSETELNFDPNYWGVNNSAYPYLKSFFGDNVSNAIKYPAVLSVIAVTPDERDQSANNGMGISMAIQMPSVLNISDVDYYLTWSNSETSGTGIIALGNNTYSPIRTANLNQTMGLVVCVTDNEEYGSRSYERQCADMMGTQTNPYLISTKLDLMHIGQSSADITEHEFPYFYDQWLSPINSLGQNYTGKVHYRLMSDVDMTMDVTLTPDEGSYTITITNDDPTTPDGVSISPLALGASLGIGDSTTPSEGDMITYQGMSFDGYDFMIKNFTFDCPFITTLDEESEVKDVLFENIGLSNDSGAHLALIETNNGSVDGAIVRNSGQDSRKFSTLGYAAGIAVFNNGTISNSIADVTIEGGTYIGGIAAENKGTISKSVSGCDITTSAASDSFVGGFVGKNDTSSSITNSFSYGSVGIDNESAATNIGGFVGTNNGSISAAYSRTNTTGYDNVGAFVGANNASIEYAYAAGRATVLNELSTQNSVFAGFSGVNSSEDEVVFDKAMAGSSLYKVLTNAATTEDIVSLNGFSENAIESFSLNTEEMAYPQLSEIVNNGVVDQNGYEHVKTKLLKAYSQISVFSLKTAYGQYVDTLTLGSINSLSMDSDLVWSSSDESVVIDAGSVTVPNEPGSAVLTAALTVVLDPDISQEITIDADLPISFGGRNPNFALIDSQYGDGTVLNPYLIESNEQFAYLSFFGSEPESSYKLVSDLDFEGLYCDPIITFRGNFDGNYKSISDYTLSNNTGLFGDIIDGSVSNLALMGVNQTAPVPASETALCYGLLAGSIQGAGASLNNCTVAGDLEINPLTSEDSPTVYAGGIVGYAGPGTQVNSCATTGRVICTVENSDCSVGGVVGLADTAEISDVFSTSYVMSIGNIGGLAGALINSSSLDGGIFAGTALDSAARIGTVADSANNLGNIAGICDSDISNVYYDSSYAIVSDFIGEIAVDSQLSGFYDDYTPGVLNANIPGWSRVSGNYSVPAGLISGASGSVFEKVVSFISMPVELQSAAGSATIFSFNQIGVPTQTSAGDSVTADELPRESDILNSQALQNITLFFLPDSLIDTSAVYTGIEFSIGNLNNTVSRYFEPRLSRSITVSYTLLNSSGASNLDSKTVGIYLKNKHGGTMTTSSDIFTTVNSTDKPVFDEISVSSNGFYIGQNLPSDYKYKVSLLNESSQYVECTQKHENEYGTFVDISSFTVSNDITIKIEIISINPKIWGIKKVWDSLVDF